MATRDKPRQAGPNPPRSTPATKALARAGLPYVLHTVLAHDVESISAPERAADLGIDPRRVFTTLLVATDIGTVAAVIPAPAALDLEAVAASTGSRSASIADLAVWQPMTGYPTTCTSPLGMATDAPVLLDVTATAFTTIVIESGVPGLLIELAPEFLLDILLARSAPIGMRQPGPIT